MRSYTIHNKTRNTFFSNYKPFSRRNHNVVNHLRHKWTQIRKGKKYNHSLKLLKSLSAKSLINPLPSFPFVPRAMKLCTFFKIKKKIEVHKYYIVKTIVNENLLRN